ESPGHPAGALSSADRGRFGESQGMQPGPAEHQQAVQSRPGAGSLAAVLQQALPAGAEVAVRWREGAGARGGSASAGVGAALSDRAEHLLLARPGQPMAAAGPLDQAWEGEHGRAAIAVELVGELAPAVQSAWSNLARRLVDAHLDKART